MRNCVGPLMCANLVLFQHFFVPNFIFRLLYVHFLSESDHQNPFVFCFLFVVDLDACHRQSNFLLFQRLFSKESLASTVVVGYKVY